MNKMGEKHFREEESVRETIFRGKKLPLEVITCFRLDIGDVRMLKSACWTYLFESQPS